MRVLVSFSVLNYVIHSKASERQADILINQMKRRRVLMSTDGPDHTVIKIKPPLLYRKYILIILLLS